MKRIIDVTAVVLTAPVWLPVLLVAAGVSLLVQGRPVFFRQTRAGKGGKPFEIIKLRSMATGEGTDEARLTRFGRFLRGSSLDELPELLNVLAGDMSLVGPRPLPIAYLPRYTEEERRRHDVTPGITGWAQVNGRNAISWEEKFRLDLEYVRRRSLAFDAKILLMTVWQMIVPRGISHEGSATMPEFGIDRMRGNMA